MLASPSRSAYHIQWKKVRHCGRRMREESSPASTQKEFHKTKGRCCRIAQKVVEFDLDLEQQKRKLNRNHQETVSESTALTRLIIRERERERERESLPRIDAKAINVERVQRFEASWLSRSKLYRLKMIPNTSNIPSDSAIRSALIIMMSKQDNQENTSTMIIKDPRSSSNAILPNERKKSI